ncbi:MAG: dephospho-CoA kinase [Gammaproteobacteria bacterium]|nr:MAG: dephospho-CoA kinase [Gammaproteobacteria bacterium]
MIVGLTGGIGSGKSEVSRRFEKLGIDVVDADLVAREVVSLGKPALKKIEEYFGPEILLADQTLNRSILRELIFNDSNKKKWLESLLHPIIRADLIAQLNRSKSPYKILSSPLLLETSQHEIVDRILVVDADESLQLSRAMQRDTNSPDQIKKIMATQMGRLERCSKADDIIKNHGDFNELDIQVKKLHNFYLQLTKH